MSKILIGADPEFFLFNTKTQAYVSAHGMVKGTKQKPERVPRGAVQVDGMALEFNIDPANTVADFLTNISTVVHNLRLKVKDKNLEFAFTPTATFDKDYFENVPLVAKELGCDPDFDAYTGDANPRPSTDEPFRTASGHIHVGWTSGVTPGDPFHYTDCRVFTKQLDRILYPASLLWDNDNKRRTLYGKPGAFRPKVYGVEYRVLSNKWLTDPKLQTWIFRAVHRADHLLNNGVMLEQHNYFSESEIRERTDFSKDEIVEYMRFLTTEYAVPSLPQEYLDA